MNIGDWVIRERRRHAHLVESVIADDAITRCGRRLHDEPNTRGELLVAEHGTLKCLQCVSNLEIGGN
jgi:hypothetical protein